MKIQSLSSDPRADGTSDEVFVVQINSIAAFIFFFFSNQFGISGLQESWIMLEKLQTHIYSFNNYPVVLSLSRLRM